MRSFVWTPRRARSNGRLPFGLPVVALIDTPGAYPGVGAEERHISEAIAVNLREMMVLKTPIISVVIGEGGSGGALGIGVADRVLMLENAYYSVISPEGCAAILWKHRSHAPEAAEALKLTARDLEELKLIDEVVPGVKFSLSFSRGRRSFELAEKLEASAVPGMALNLGDVKVKLEPTRGEE